MPMSVKYATVNGRMVQENRGGTVTKYVPDTLGSVIQTRDATGAQTSTAHYWPFGEVRTSTGTNPSPWGFVGTYGYHTDAPARQYVRARYLRNDLSRWLTVDPLWNGFDPFGYTLDPLVMIDPTGLRPNPIRPNPGDELRDCILSKTANYGLGLRSPYSYCVQCVRERGLGNASAICNKYSKEANKKELFLVAEMLESAACSYDWKGDTCETCCTSISTSRAGLYEFISDLKALSRKGAVLNQSECIERCKYFMDFHKNIMGREFAEGFNRMDVLIGMITCASDDAEILTVIDSIFFN
jgi:RHS repeat-associated protein